MLGAKYFIVVTQREYAERYLDYLREQTRAAVFYKLVNGTATDTALSRMGLEKTEKIMFEGLIRDECVAEFKKGLINRLDISSAGNGIAFFIPADGIGGESAKKYLTGDAPVSKRETNMEERSRLVLIIAVTDKGNTDLVMNAARSAGASGGTVAKAKGTGAEIAKFFGISITEEKEMTYIVAKRESRDAIMRAIMEKAGWDTPAHGVTFSLPVDDVAGIRSLED